MQFPFANMLLKMLFYITVIITLVSGVVCTENQQLKQQILLQDCPPANELLAASCICHAQLHYLICDGNSAYFSFQSNYHFKKLIIKNSPKLPFWTERLQSPNQLQVESLLLLQDSKPEVVDNFDELLQLPSLQSLEVVSNGHIDLRFTDIPTTLKAISISNVASLLRHQFDGLLDDFKQIETVHLRNLRFSPPFKNGLFIESLPLKVLQLNNVSLSGKFAFVPPSPSPSDVNNQHEVTIDLRNNELTYFDFGTLFPAGNNPYSYYINLSENSKLDPNLLTSQLTTLKAQAANLSIYLNDVKLACSCELQELAAKHKFIHGVHCANFKGELLETLSREKMHCS